MGGWCVYLYWTLLCSTGLLHSCARVQTEESKTKHLPYFKTAEDGNEKQLVSSALFLLVFFKYVKEVSKEMINIHLRQFVKMGVFQYIKLFADQRFT